jgi:uncharacterized protein (DUF2132 family)
MLGQKKKLAKQAFSRTIVTTFGKVTQRDIDEIDGRIERLSIRLMELYGWDAEEAQVKIDAFLAQLSNKPAYISRKFSS